MYVWLHVLFFKSVKFFSWSLVFIIAVFSILRCMIFHWSINPNWFNHFPTVKHFGSFQLCLFIRKAWSAFYVVNTALKVRDINSPCSWQIQEERNMVTEGETWNPTAWIQSSRGIGPAPQLTSPSTKSASSPSLPQVSIPSTPWRIPSTLNSVSVSAFWIRQLVKHHKRKMRLPDPWVEMERESHIRHQKTWFKSQISHREAVWSFFLIIYFNWRLITLQYCSGICHKLTWISHRCTLVPHPEPPSHLPPHPIPLGCPSALALSTCLMHQTWTGNLFHIW